MLYADDIVIVAANLHMLAALCAVILKWCLLYNMLVNAAKSAIMIV